MLLLLDVQVSCASRLQGPLIQWAGGPGPPSSRGPRATK